MLKSGLGYMIRFRLAEANLKSYLKTKHNKTKTSLGFFSVSE